MTGKLFEALREPLKPDICPSHFLRLSQLVNYACEKESMVKRTTTVRAFNKAMPSHVQSFAYCCKPFWDAICGSGPHFRKLLSSERFPLRVGASDPMPLHELLNVFRIW